MIGLHGYNQKKDIEDFWNQVKYFFGKSKEKAKFGRFSFIEKFDYWAVYWGFVIMIGSGIIMWLFQGRLNPWLFGEIDLARIPFTVDNYIHAISREAHSDEALLATLAIIVWHFYNVHFNPDKFPGNHVWISGKMSKEEMETEHPLELEEIEKSEMPAPELKDEKVIEDQADSIDKTEIKDEAKSVENKTSEEAKVEAVNNNETADDIAPESESISDKNKDESKKNE